MGVVLLSVASLGGISVVAAVILFVAAKRFHVDEDPKIDQVEEILPGANCGGCGYAGCRNFAEASVQAEDLSELFCPVGGNPLTEKIATILGIEAAAQEPMIAVVRCHGSKKNAPIKVAYNGASSCRLSHQLFSGESGCPHGCMGLGDCVVACPFDAIQIDSETGLPVVSEEKCTACGKCVIACPRRVIELRPKGKKGRRVYISCINEEKGGVAKKHCSVACIGCGKCMKACPFGAIVVKNNLAYIDPILCKNCRKCVAVCPTQAILTVNFPPPKRKPEEVPQQKITQKRSEKSIEKSDERGDCSAGKEA